MCALLATFLNHAAVHIFISWNFLASLHWGRESSVRGSFLSGKTYREACELYKALVNEMKHKRGTIILELFIIYSFGNRHCYMQPASLGSVTPDFPAPSFIVFGSFFILLHLLTRLLLSIINYLTLNICLNAKIMFFCLFVFSFKWSSSSYGCIVHCPFCAHDKEQAREELWNWCIAQPPLPPPMTPKPSDFIKRCFCLSGSSTALMLEHSVAAALCHVHGFYRTGQMESF